MVLTPAGKYLQPKVRSFTAYVFALIYRGLSVPLLLSIISVKLLLLLLACLLVWKKLKPQSTGERWEKESVWV